LFNIIIKTVNKNKEYNRIKIKFQRENKKFIFQNKKNLKQILQLLHKKGLNKK